MHVINVLQLQSLISLRKGGQDQEIRQIEQLAPYIKGQLYGLLTTGKNLPEISWFA